MSTIDDGKAIRLIYVTIGSADEAEAMGRTLIEERLAACVNIFPATRSIYRWNDAIETASEAVMIVKTTVEGLVAAMHRIRDLHDYDNPCVIALAVEHALPLYQAWVAGAIEGMLAHD